jgi:hypothetical protein
MWIFDGEQWTEEGVSDSATKPELQAPRPEGMFYPELQVIEVVPVPVPRTNYIPFPLP